MTMTMPSVADRAYAERFPNRRHKEQRLLETGNLKTRKNQASCQPILIVSFKKSKFLNQSRRNIEYKPSNYSVPTSFPKRYNPQIIKKNGMYSFMSQKVQVFHNGDMELNCRA